MANKVITYRARRDMAGRCEAVVDTRGSVWFASQKEVKSVATSLAKPDCDEATLKNCFMVYQGIQDQVRFADSKAAFIATLNAVLFGFLASNFLAIKAMLSNNHGAALIVPVVVFGLYLLTAGSSVGLVIMAVTSRFTKLAPESKIFFGHIIRTYGKEFWKYAADVQAMDDADWVKDISAQIVDVSHIALAKHRLVRYAAQSTFGAFVLFVLAFIVSVTMK